MSVWNQIKKALEAGEDPVVILNYSMLATVVEPAAPVRRVPKVKKRIHFSLYSKTPAAGRKTHTHRCWNPYCRKRITGRFVCNDGCRTLAIEHLQTALSLLDCDETAPIRDEEIADVPVFDEQGLGRFPDGGKGRAGGKGKDPRGRKPKIFRARPKESSYAATKTTAEIFSREDG
jgi:hypothetical protein